LPAFFEAGAALEASPRGAFLAAAGFFAVYARGGDGEGNVG